MVGYVWMFVYRPVEKGPGRAQRMTIRPSEVWHSTLRLGCRAFAEAIVLTDLQKRGISRRLGLGGSPLGGGGDMADRIPHPNPIQYRLIPSEFKED
jgi:hypothetical protein